MRAVEVGIGIDHLGLYPYTELYTLCLDLFHKACKSVGEFLAVLKPIAKSRAIVVSLSKPTVVHYEHIKACLFCFSREIEKYLLVYTEVAGFPCVEHHGVRLKRHGRHYVISYKSVEIS